MWRISCGSACARLTGAIQTTIKIQDVQRVASITAHRTYRSAHPIFHIRSKSAGNLLDQQIDLQCIDPAACVFKGELSRMKFQR